MTPRFAFGSTDHEPPYSWLLHLAVPFILTHHVFRDDRDRLLVWPHVELPALSELLAYDAGPGWPIASATHDDELPKYLFLESPEESWIGVLCLRSGRLFTPGPDREIYLVPNFSVPPMINISSRVMAANRDEAQRWYHHFFQKP